MRAHARETRQPVLNDLAGLSGARRMSHGQQFARVARRTPQAEALRFEHDSRTFAQLDERVDRLAGALSSRGVGTGDRVATLMMNRMEVVETYLATSRLVLGPALLHEHPARGRTHGRRRPGTRRTAPVRPVGCSRGDQRHPGRRRGQAAGSRSREAAGSRQGVKGVGPARSGAAAGPGPAGGPRGSIAHQVQGELHVLLGDLLGARRPGRGVPLG